MFSKIEIFLANLSFVILFLTMFYYWYQLSLGFQVERRLQTQSLIVAESTVASQTPPFPHSSNVREQRSIGEQERSSRNSVTSARGASPSKSTLRNRTIPNIAILTSFSSLLVLLILRWKEFGHFPLSNLYESLIFLSLSCLLIHFLTQNSFFTYERSEFSIQGEHSLRRSDAAPILDQAEESQSSVVIPNLFGSITASCALCINAFASFSLPDEMQQGSALVPALQSNWLMMHVTVMITSYGALIVGSLFSIAYLVIDTILKTRSASHEYSQRSSNLILTLDNLSYRIIGLGFPLLTIGILSGAVWANEAWGSYWSWDPKETWALLTWFVFAIYLHTRITRGWEGRKSAIMASIGFITVWICFLGVNLLGEGLHSYGFLAK